MQDKPILVETRYLEKGTVVEHKCWEGKPKKLMLSYLRPQYGKLLE